MNRPEFVCGEFITSFNPCFLYSLSSKKKTAGKFASSIGVDKITTLLPHAFKQSAVGLSAGFADVLAELFA